MAVGARRARDGAVGCRGAGRESRCVAACAPPAGPPAPPSPPVITSFARAFGPHRGAGRRDLRVAGERREQRRADLSGRRRLRRHRRPRDRCRAARSSSVLEQFDTAGTRTATLEVTDGTSDPVVATTSHRRRPPGRRSPTTSRCGSIPSMRPEFRQAFTDAAARWESVLVAGVPDVRARPAGRACSAGCPAYSGVVDDVLIDARDSADRRLRPGARPGRRPADPPARLAALLRRDGVRHRRPGRPVRRRAASAT